MSGSRHDKAPTGAPLTTAPGAARRAGHPSWPVVGVILLGVLLVFAAGLGALRNVAASQRGSIPAASPGAGSTARASPIASPGASPMAGTTVGAGQAGDNQPANEAISSITQRIVHDNPIMARAQGPDTSHAVFDPYRILTSDQATSLAGDAGRLKGAGLPTLVYIRISLNNQAQSQQFATSLVEKPGMVESSNGAQDGLVVLVSIPPGAPQKGNIAIAYGKNALPVNGLDAATIQQIDDRGMIPRMAQGDVFQALQFGLRQFNYVVAYTPYAVPRLSSTARTIGGWLSIGAPLLAGLTILLLVASVGARRRRPAGAGWRRWLARWWPGVLAGAFWAIFIPLSVYARSRIGVFAAAAVIAALLVDAWGGAHRSTRRPTRRVITVTGSLPGRLASRQRALRDRDHGQGMLQ